MKGNYWMQADNPESDTFIHHQCPEEEELSKRDKEQKLDNGLQQQSAWKTTTTLTNEGSEKVQLNTDNNNSHSNYRVDDTLSGEEQIHQINSFNINRGKNIEVQDVLKDIDDHDDDTRTEIDRSKLEHLLASKLLNKSDTDSIGEFQEDLRVFDPVQWIKKEENEVNLSFCGCGFLGIYHVGVASCFHQYAPQLSMHKIAGSSAGALVAVAHICGNLQLAYATTDILRVAIDARARALGPFHPSFDIQATVREALDRGLPEDVHLKASGKLHISLTRAYDGENVVVSEFDSKEEVIQALLCSCFIPFWSGWVAPKFRGTSYIDGGFSVNLLILDDKTVSVSPFAGEADICPQDDSLNLLQVSLSNMSFSISPNNLYRLSHALLPPPPEVLSDLCEQGFADGIRFLQKMKLISCTKCLEIRSSLLVTTNGEDMEEAFTQQVHSSESMKSTSSFSENNHIRLEQQEQKTIEINQRRNSVVSTTSQVYQQQQPQANSDIHETSLPTSIPDMMLIHPNDSYESCHECVRMRQKALHNTSLPTQFSDRIRDACDAVNKSLSNWIYSYRPIKYLSYLAAPYYLPLDISLALMLRCWQELPFIRSELFNCVINVAEFIIKIVKQLQTRSTSSLLMDSSPVSGWDDDDVKLREYEKKKPIKKLNLTSNKQPSITSNDSLNYPPTINLQPEPSKDRVQALNHTQAHNNNNNNNNNGSSNGNESAISVRITSDGVCVSKLRNSRSSSTTHLHSLEDTFDSIVDVTSNQEARIFAYYFRDAKNRLQVTEIFDLQRAAELQSTSLSSNSSSLSQLHPTLVNTPTTTPCLSSQSQPPKGG